MYRHLIFSILIFLFHKSHGQDLYENLEIEIKKNVDWYAGILIEGHKMRCIYIHGRQVET